MVCPRLGLGWLPVLWSLFAGISLAICYSIATSNKHIYPLVPAISDTGLKIPENAIFSESFNFIAYSVLVLMAIRYFQVREVLTTRAVEEAPKENILKKLNGSSILLGSVAAFGATIVGNFKADRVSEEVVYRDFLTDCCTVKCTQNKQRFAFEIKKPTDHSIVHVNSLSIPPQL